MEYKYSIKSDVFGCSIMNKAFEEICQQGDLNHAIETLLFQAGSYLGFDSIHLYEFLKESHQVINTFSWNKKTENHEESLSFSYQNAKRYLELHKKEKIISIMPSKVNEEDDDIFRSCYRETAYEQVIIGAILEDGERKGFVSFERKNEMPLSDWEIENLNITVNVLNVYLLKLHGVNKIKERLAFIKNYDVLTQLPTLSKFKEDVKTRLQECPHTRCAVVYIDFKNFKYLNETVGKRAADGILKDFATHLREYYSIMGCIGRVEADRFIALLPYSCEETLKSMIWMNNENFREQMKKKCIVNNVRLNAGVCPITHGEDIGIAIDNANLARKSVKDGETSNVKVYDQLLNTKITRQIEIEQQMEEALENHEFIVYLQPKIELSSERISGAEALVRWRKTPTEMLPPAEFIPVFEKNGFIVDLDYYIYEEVCKILRRWMDEGREVLPVSVNVSGVHLNDDHFVSKLKYLVSKYEISPKYLELELTESIFLDDKEVALNTMRELREFGFLVSIDDFGAGYSSLNLLREMKSDVLKLDKGFFCTGTMNREDKIIISSIVNMAKQLNMKVLSEGIETRSQSEFLQSIECDMAQGYLYSRPVPIDQFEKMIS